MVGISGNLGTRSFGMRRFRGDDGETFGTDAPLAHALRTFCLTGRSSLNANDGTARNVPGTTPCAFGVSSALVTAGDTAWFAKTPVPVLAGFSS